jgi:dolichyl-diphosphooligosaccharide--protein glycosyltransferase
MSRVALLLVTLAAFAVRVGPRWDSVFAADGLRLADPDGWHHLRQVEQWVRHFPHRMTFDPFQLHPHGQDVPVAPLLDGIAAALAWLAGLGSPSQGTVERVTAVLPAVLGALTCLPASALGRRLGGTAGGLVAALVVAFLPGELFARSMLGFADHHALETLLAATVLALFAHALALAPPRTPRPAQAAAVALVLYLMAWTGGALLVAILTVATLAVVAADTIRRRNPADTLAAFGFVCVLALAGVALVGDSLPTARVAIGALAGGTLAVAVAWVVAAGLTGAGARPAIAVAAAVAALVVGGGLAALVLPAAQDTALAALGWFRATAERVTVAEARPLWLGDHGPSIEPAWREFGVPGLAALAGLVLLARRIVREGRRDNVLLGVVLAATIAAAFAQTRFAAGAAVAVAALAGGAVGPWLGRAWRGETADTPPWLGRGVWPATVAIALVVPTAPLLPGTVEAPPTPAGAWREALGFLRTATPEPFDDADAFERIVRREPGTPTVPSSYGVLAWWDAGYWITQIARRVPLANPTQAGAGEVARTLLETDPERAAARADTIGARYVVLDDELPISARGGAFRGRLPAVVAWSGRDERSLLRVVRERQPDGSRETVVLFLPDYFRALCVRLHSFGGASHAATNVFAVACEPGADGVDEIVASRRFATFDEAAHWVAAQPDGRAFVASTSPLAPCVPLEATDGFRLAFRSSESVPVPGREPISRVQVWERVSR